MQSDQAVLFKEIESFEASGKKTTEKTMEKTTSQSKTMKDTFQGFHFVSFERDVLSDIWNLSWGVYLYSAVDG